MGFYYINKEVGEIYKYSKTIDLQTDPNLSQTFKIDYHSCIFIQYHSNENFIRKKFRWHQEWLPHYHLREKHYEEDFDFLLGTKNKIKGGKTDAKYHKNDQRKNGIFLYPEQDYSIDYEKKKYTFRGQERISDNLDTNGENKREYNLKLYIWNTQIEIIDVKNVLNLYRDVRNNTGYQSPKIFWSSDLNRDGQNKSRSITCRLTLYLKTLSAIHCI